MTYVVMKRVKSEPFTFKVFNTWRTVPLARWQKVCCLKHMFPSANFLKTKYGLKDDDIISVRFTKKHPWTTKFKHFHNGTLKDFDKKAHDYCSRIRKQRNQERREKTSRQASFKTMRETTP